jgi:hypothetical protein
VCSCIITNAAAAAAAAATAGGKAPAGASRLALALNGTESDEQLAAIKCVDAVVALLDTPVSSLLAGSVILFGVFVCLLFVKRRSARCDCADLVVAALASGGKVHGVLWWYAWCGMH